MSTSLPSTLAQSRFFTISADRIELYTGPSGASHARPEQSAASLDRLGRSADAARACGLGVNAGDDLTVANLPALVARIPHLAEVSSGLSLTAVLLDKRESIRVPPVVQAIEGVRDVLDAMR